MNAKNPNENHDEREDIVVGPNAVESLLDSNPGKVHRLLFLKGSSNRRLHLLQNRADKMKINCQQVNQQTLNKYHLQNQGVVAHLHARELMHWEEFKAGLPEWGAVQLMIPAGVEDPRNLGACLRSCVALGVRGVLLPVKGGCGLTATVARTSAGAIENVDITRPPNLESAVDQLKNEGFTVIALEAIDEATPLSEGNFPEKILWVTGGEDKGIPPYLMKRADQVLKIPMGPKAHSYNTSVALSLALYECQRSQNFINLK